MFAVAQVRDRLDLDRDGFRAPAARHRSARRELRIALLLSGGKVHALIGHHPQISHGRADGLRCGGIVVGERLAAERHDRLQTSAGVAIVEGEPRDLRLVQGVWQHGGQRDAERCPVAAVAVLDQVHVCRRVGVLARVEDLGHAQLDLTQRQDERNIGPADKGADELTKRQSRHDRPGDPDRYLNGHGPSGVDQHAEFSACDHVRTAAANPGVGRRRGSGHAVGTHGAAFNLQPTFLQGAIRLWEVEQPVEDHSRTDRQVGRGNGELNRHFQGIGPHVQLEGVGVRPSVAVEHIDGQVGTIECGDRHRGHVVQ